MLKVIRKYNKMILVVGGSLLMVSFLMPQAIEQFGKAQRGRAVGMMDGRKVTAAQFDLAVREVRAMEAFFNAGGRVFPIGLEDNREAEHWLLLSNEAEQAGLVGGAEEGEALLPVLAREMVIGDYQRQYRQYAETVIAQQPDMFEQQVSQRHELLAMARGSVAGQNRLLPEEFDKGLARLRGVVRMLNRYHGAERLSDKQAVEIADRLADSVLIDAVVLDGRTLADESLTPTPEELQAHFERFRSQRPGTGEFGIGFLLPPRVKLEWIELDGPAISQAVSVSMIDATKHWQQNRDRYPGEFDIEQPRVEADLRGEQATRVMNTAESVIRAAVQTALRPLNEEEGYRELPGSWPQERPDLIQLAEQVVQTVRDRHGVTIPLPAVYIRDEGWLDGQMLEDLDGIGAGAVAFERNQFTFPQAVMAVRELAGDNPLGVQELVPAINLPVQTAEGSKYFFTVLDTVPEAMPESIDELLDPERVAATWRAMRFYEDTVGSAGTIVSTVAADGLESYAESFGRMDPPPAAEGQEPLPGALKAPVTENARVTEAETTLQRFQQSTEIIEMVREKGRTIDPKSPIDDIPLLERVTVVPVPSRLAVVVAQINGVQPLTRETRPIVTDYARRVRQQELFGGIGVPYPYRYPILASRHAFSMKSDSEEESGETDSVSTDEGSGEEAAEGDAAETPEGEDQPTGE